MGKEIQLYSKDNKYMCFIELADSKDKFGCPDHSRIMLFEERNKKAYFIADARDKLLETEKDQRIAELEQELAKYKDLQDRLGLENVDELEWFVMLDLLTDNEKNMHILDLHRELAELKEKAIVPRFKFDEECVVIMFGSYHFHRFIAQVKDDLCLTQPYNDTEEWYYVKPEMVFKTLEEAQAKLKEIQGNE